MGFAIVASDHAGDRGAVCTANILDIAAASDGALAAQHIAGGCGLTVGIGHVAHGCGVILGHRLVVEDIDQNRDCCAVTVLVGDRHIELIGGRLGSIIHRGFELVGVLHRGLASDGVWILRIGNGYLTVRGVDGDAVARL